MLRLIAAHLTNTNIDQVLLPYLSGEPRVWHCPGDIGWRYTPNCTSVFESFGTSYIYRTELVSHVPVPALPRPAEINVVVDAAAWHRRNANLLRRRARADGAGRRLLHRNARSHPLRQTPGSERRHDRRWSCRHPRAGHRAEPAATLPVTGGSMMPLLQPGDRLEVELLPRALRLGDVVVFRAGGVSIAHRIVAMHRGRPDAPRQLITKGDRARACDAPILSNQVIARVVAIHRGGRVVRLDGRGSAWLAVGAAVLSRWQSLFYGALGRLAPRGLRRSKRIPARVLRRAGRIAAALPLRAFLRLWAGCHPAPAAGPELTAEARLLLLAARVRLSADEREAFAALVTGRVDWSAVLRVACDQGPDRCCTTTSRSRVSGRPCRAAASRSSALCTPPPCAASRLRGQLRSLLMAAAEAGQPLVVLKGAALAELVSELWPAPDVGSGRAGAPGQLPRVEALLTSLGYSPRQADPATRAPQERVGHHLSFTHPQAASPVEAHWCLAGPHRPFQLDVAAMWQRSRQVTIAGAPAHILAVEDNLVYLALHFFQHGALSLHGFCDVAELTKQHAVDWDLVIARARAARASLVVGHTLWWVREYLQAPVPETVIAALCPDAPTLERRRAGTGSPIPRPGLVGNRLAILGRQFPFLPFRWRLRRIQQTFLPGPTAIATIRPLRGSPWRYLAFLFRPARLRRAVGDLRRVIGTRKAA